MKRSHSLVPPSTLTLTKITNTNRRPQRAILQQPLPNPTHRLKLKLKLKPQRSNRPLTLLSPRKPREPNSSRITVPALLPALLQLHDPRHLALRPPALVRFQRRWGGEYGYVACFFAVLGEVRCGGESVRRTSRTGAGLLDRYRSYGIIWREGCEGTV
ncbi:hypothetical protein M501DRAFT_998041 [Patellaria atrata CBS 101060]|uniref:Uncharacterized protein n=1 Tax=Patellaria atrata CBS 101060 TaxID=1346257 RepID=A0A9P4VTU2_9PEZI|nr:hypothetical protein M501DRAFT_998041 [Patellaria atrata CBS 101060]